MARSSRHPSAVVAEFEEQRSRLFGLAYRLLSSADEAEDVVQDAFIRWSGSDRSMIVAPRAWLSKVVTNLCLTRLTAARAQREQYVGWWLPEPVLTADGTLGPLETAEQRDSVSFAVLVLLERLTPAERAVFVLREAFAYSHREIADMMELTEANCRQLHRRARGRMDAAEARFQPDRRQQHQLVERFLAAAQKGDLSSLHQLLTAEVISWADGGGKVPAARRPVHGRERVARYIVGGIHRFAVGLDIVVNEVNGVPAVLGWAGGTLVGVLVPQITDGRISALHIAANPEKLAFLARQASRLSHSGGLAGS